MIFVSLYLQMIFSSENLLDCIVNTDMNKFLVILVLMVSSGYMLTLEKLNEPEVIHLPEMNIVASPSKTPDERRYDHYDHCDDPNPGL
jgi:hypothetical protein